MVCSHNCPVRGFQWERHREKGGKVRHAHVHPTHEQGAHEGLGSLPRAVGSIAELRFTGGIRLLGGSGTMWKQGRKHHGQEEALGGGRSMRGCVWREKSAALRKQW